MFDIREQLPCHLGVAGVHVKPHGTRRDVEARREPPQADQVLEALALRHERYALGFERGLREREGHGVCGLKDCDHFGGCLMSRDTCRETAEESRPCPWSHERPPPPRGCARWPGTRDRTRNRPAPRPSCPTPPDSRDRARRECS